MTMSQTILKELKEFESQNNVTVLLAVEAGSRACGLESKDSDYDVRFVYVHDKDYYLQLGQFRDNVELVHTDELDIVGWDLQKFLRLMHKSNCSVYEWLNTEVYFEHPCFRYVREIASHYYNRKRLAYHYYHMYKHHDAVYIRNHHITEKRYLHTIRSLMAAQWAIEHDEPVPFDFASLLEGKLPEELIPIVDGIIVNKKCGIADDFCKPILELEKWLTKKEQEISEKLMSWEYRHETDNCSWEPLNNIFLTILNEL